uniref:C2H2-type domain-containing protein n=1 Tax=Gouania willdenowi TaxID=441366 RepID=A0A8C5DIN9_GOUWI
MRRKSSAYQSFRHLLLHQQPQKFICDVCGRGFSRAYRLSEHVRSHTGERPYQCGVCNKRFTTHSVLWKHRKIHRTAPRPEDKDQPVSR